MQCLSVYIVHKLTFTCVCIAGPNRESVQCAFESARGPYGGRGQKDMLVCTMDAGGGTFHCATMLCGNNAQTNDSVVAAVITSGTHWAFPLLASISLSLFLFHVRSLARSLSALLRIPRGRSFFVSCLSLLPIYPLFGTTLIAKSTHFRGY